jgi:hypothetical protein
VATKEAEKKKLADQEALVAAHRKTLKERPRGFHVKSSYIVPKGTFTHEQLAEFMASHPSLSEEQARVLLSMEISRTAQAVKSGPENVSPQEVDAAVSLAPEGPAPVVNRRTKPVKAPKVASSEKPEPAAVHIEASVAVPFKSDDAEDDNHSDRDWSDFDPVAWEEDQPYPEDRFRSVLREDGCRGLVRRTDLDELVEPEVTPEIQALLDRQQELENAQDALVHRHGRERMKWATEVTTEMNRLEEEISAIRKRLAIARDRR